MTEEQNRVVKLSPIRYKQQRYATNTCFLEQLYIKL